MSFSLLPMRFARPIARGTTRCISSSSRSQSNDILDILKPAAQNHPSTPKPQASGSKQTAAFKLARRNLGPRSNVGQEMEKSAKAETYTKQMFRKWNAGDVYSPHDLSGAEQKKWKMGRRTPPSDVFDTLGINPINEYKNFTMMSEYMSEMGRIKHSKLTGLRPVNQRKVAKAVRRAIGLGLMPSVHRHPLVLKKSSPSRFL
ncbi:ribosomal protein S18 [Aaosphaeria arxii CBS 175.79]|uniref:Small ribosomal subunit protein bS18m n=1 Tax=Aaosphaeria arxii CBS 175.79 TaxID=1450172 RepID=A0A6A5X6E9_9PLEO|nr:ribosomal protein S18 [Aaosphaeria arxii CBS 175.79]KAF2008523.1 ribosomal protein S18 [Aaosphaeria arxii CBS 175.79]